MLRISLFIYICLGLFLLQPVYGEKVDRLLELLEKKGILTQQEVQELKTELAVDEKVSGQPEAETAEKQSPPITTVPAESVPAPPQSQSMSVSQKVKFSGDLRMRYDSQRLYGGDNRYERRRGRYRLRFGIDAQPAETLKIGFRLASGNGLQNTTNQSFDGHGRSSPIFIDRVFASWKPAKWFELVGGKHKNFFYTTPLVWDSDVNLQGLSEIFSWSGEKTQFTGLFTQFLVEEVNDVTGRNGDPLMLGYQGAIKTVPWDRTSLDLAVSYYDFRNMDMINSSGLGDSDTFEGYNHRNGQQMVYDQNRRLLNEWDTLELNAKFKVKDVILGQPLAFFGSYIKNTSADVERLRNEGVAVPGSDPADLFAYGDDDRDTGHLFGGEIGFHEKRGDLRLSYFYQVLEDFAFPAVFVDSDFHGGGTNNRGHRAMVNYFLRDNIELRGIFFFTKRDSEAKDGQRDENRAQLDVIFDF